MKTQANNQSGSMHAIVIGVLTLALIGSVCFIFWQNFVDKPVADTKKLQKSETSEDSKKEVLDDESEIVLDKTLINEVDGYTITLDYPSTWSLEETTYNQILSSADEKVNIVVRHIENDGLGGTGAPNVDTIKRIDLTNSSGNFEIVQFTSEYGEPFASKYVKKSDRYVGGAGIYEKGAVSIGDLINLMFTEDDPLDDESPVFQVILENSSSTNDFHKTLFASDEYKEALAILKSFRITRD